MPWPQVTVHVTQVCIGPEAAQSSGTEKAQVQPQILSISVAFSGNMARDISRVSGCSRTVDADMVLSNTLGLGVREALVVIADCPDLHSANVSMVPKCQQVPRWQPRSWISTQLSMSLVLSYLISVGYGILLVEWALSQISYAQRVVENGMKAQSGNPEVRVRGSDPVINQIIDKLKHVIQ
ncbi:hypothetical protein STEG23_004467, partial [Scotinomys teguina]